ncbi:Lar family restriction alleviation protein [Agrobacterium tumefaciens]|nr:Lar family restriction alleviation protein [Agrobacterium tumefaciens]
MNGLPMKPCPFCGEEPTMQPWHGGLPTKKLIICTNAGFHDGDGGCSVRPSVTGETEEEAVASWNRRSQIGVSIELENVKRFDYGTVHKCGQQPRGIMIEAEDGEYVLFDDVASEFFCSGHADGMSQAKAEMVKLGAPVDWTAVAKAAGRHGIRYASNAALEAFLSDIALATSTAENTEEGGAA